ncbi:hypothetical protein B9Z55_018237 [Caenorhabditis nigoni]|uniref:Uncharacterized protein n=1 Tax=Caenorhabditis nigoni TaxID=1611254 RepID=A0A2G5TD78_9PELO|nr:hypothetical protein B9Z55_018237 [Caenorhabditis nigoni]
MLREGGGVADDGLEDSLSLSLFLRGQRGNYDGHGFGEQEKTREDSARRRKNANEGRRDAPEKRRRHDGDSHHTNSLTTTGKSMWRRGEEGVEKKKKKSSTTSSWWRSFDTQTVRWMAPRGNASLLRL